jgi:signal transduction histidine kinase/ligand-binding sensor domain-containing protein
MTMPNFLRDILLGGIFLVLINAQEERVWADDSLTQPKAGSGHSAGISVVERQANRERSALVNVEYMISIWQKSEGLPTDVIKDITQTRDGYLWLGTARGLVRFDGLKFDVVADDAVGLKKNSRIKCLSTDEEGKLWISVEGKGIFGFEQGKVTAISTIATNKTGLGMDVLSLCNAGAAGMMWVDTEGNAGTISLTQPVWIKRLDGRFSPVAHWRRDFTGRLWLMGAFHAFQYEAATLREFPTPGDLSLSMVAVPKHGGGLWVARNAQLHMVNADGRDAETIDFPWGRASRVSAMLEDGQHRLWIGTESEGLFCYNGSKIMQIVPTVATITCLFQDSENNIWAGTQGGGLLRMRPRQFLAQEQGKDSRDGSIRNMAQDGKGEIWAVLPKGILARWENGDWLPQTGGPTNVISLCPAAGGGVWISTDQPALWKWNNGAFQEYDWSTNQLAATVIHLLEDRQGRLWMVTSDTHILYLKDGKLINVPISNFSGERIRQIVEDDAGTIWVGSWEGEIACWRKDKWELIRKPTGFKDAVQSMFSSGGAMWICLSGGSLLRSQGGKMAEISVDQGLPDASIHQMLPDGLGSLWGATSHRLFRLSMNQLNSVMDGREQKVDCIVYGRSDGVPDTLFANLASPGCFRMRDGSLWFATVNGGIQFQPSVNDKHIIPQAVINQVLFNGKVLADSELQNLRPGPGRLEFHFSAPSMTVPGRVSFRFQLDGVDHGWVDAGPLRLAAYDIITPGQHTFQVLACSPDGEWDTHPATVTITAHPYFWQTTWFWTLAAALLAGGGVWVVRRSLVRNLNHRLRQLHQENMVARERERIANDLHDDLGARATQISLLSGMSKDQLSFSSEARTNFNQITQMSRELITALYQTVWAINPENDNLDAFGNYICQIANRLCERTPVRCRFQLSGLLGEIQMSTQVRHNLSLAAKEAVHNIIKHADAKDVIIAVEYAENLLTVSIRDNGRGFSLEQKHDGNGLNNMNRRLKDIGGTYLIESGPNQGTIVTLKLSGSRLLADTLPNQPKTDDWN